jgi:predicted sulfurtransferase
MGERISEDVLGKCDLCGEPCDHYTNCARKACHQLFIQCPACSERLNGCCGPTCQELLAQATTTTTPLNKNPHPTKYTKGRLKQGH